MIRLSIIIVSYNVKFYVQQCIEAIHNSTSQDFEIIIIDNNSTDGSADFLEQKYREAIILIKNQINYGFGKACNQGLDIAKGEFTLFLNPDTIINPNTLKKCLDFANQTENLGLLGVRMIDDHGTFLAESKRGIPSPKASFFRLTGLHSLLANSKIANAYYAPHVGEFEIGKVDVISGAFMLGETEKLKVLKGFDEDYFMYGEDVDLSFRSQLAGYDNYYLGSETIIHHKGKSTDKLNKEYTNRFYGAMSIFHKKHVKDSYSWLFNVLISLAIISRKAISTFTLMLKNSFLPLFELSLFIGGGLIIKYLWSRFYFENVHYYNDSGANINLICYSIFWAIVLLFGSSYRYYKKRSVAIIQLVIGLILILTFYSILPEEWRSSRALIGFYFMWNVLVVMICRTVYTFFAKEDFRLGQKIGIVASPKMLDVYHAKNKERLTNLKSLVFIRPSTIYKDDRCIGDIEDVLLLVTDYSLDSVLISVDEYELTEVKTTVDFLKEHGIQSTIIDQYDLEHVLADKLKHKGLLDSKALDFKILFWENTFTKRSFDLTFSVLLIPIALFHSQIKITELIDVILNKKSLIGYQSKDNLVHKLPYIKTGVIPVTRKRGLLNNVHVENLDYAMNYTVIKDFKHLVSHLL